MKHGIGIDLEDNLKEKLNIDEDYISGFNSYQMKLGTEGYGVG